MIEPWRNPVTARRCDGKREYRTESYAAKVAQRDSERSGEYIVAYQCFDCRQWHVGHADRTQQIVIEQMTERKLVGRKQPLPVSLGGKRCQNPECTNEFRNDMMLSGEEELGLYCSKTCKRRAARLRKLAAKGIQ